MIKYFSLLFLVIGFESSYALNASCVTTAAINDAFQAAKLKTNFVSISSDPTEFELDKLGRTLLEATNILAQKCKITPSEIYSALPLINTNNTIINTVCPAVFKPYACDATRYREMDGSCNNLANPLWGSVYAPYRRLLAPAYADSISAPRKAISGADLPPPRQVSVKVHKNIAVSDQALTVHFVSWGQLIDHDLVETSASTTSSGGFLTCCGVTTLPQACLPISVPLTDPFFSVYEVDCLDFARDAVSPRKGCSLGTREQFNIFPSILDANMIYGEDTDVMATLRSYSGGLLKTAPVFKSLGLKDLPPLKTVNPDEDCFRTNTSVYCFLTGDSRSNQQPMLSAPHTIFMREHNRIATALKVINPTWTDEKLYQESRHIVAALIQKITYDEYLPLLIGKDQMTKYGLGLLTTGYFTGYNSTIDPTLPNAFPTAAYRFAHSMVPSEIQRWSAKHQLIGSQKFSTLFYQPWDLYKPGYVDQYLLGMMNQVAQKTDDAVTDELTNHLEQEPGDAYGTDLAARNILRGREHGLPAYNQYRIYCGLAPARKWTDLVGVMKNETILSFSQVYASPEDLDLWSAGISEFPVLGGAVGPTFACIIGQTFQNLRIGDRFWFENGNQPSSFTLGQLAEIRKVKYARIICDNSDAIETVQMNVMSIADPTKNPRVACKNSTLPSMDLTKWKGI